MTLNNKGKRVKIKYNVFLLKHIDKSIVLCG